jgi:isopentenyl-diphosphate delta-isomerase
LDKYHSGGLWANACCSHPRWGEPLEESVQNRLEAELGIPKGSCYPQEKFSFVYYCKYDGLSEYEYDHVLVTDYHGHMAINPEEIMDTRWIELNQLKKELQEEPQKFSAWFLIAAPRVLELYL